MASDTLLVQIDTTATLAGFDQLASVMERHLLAKGLITATNIKNEAQRRVKRRTGETMRGIVVRSGAGHQPGWAVIATNQRMPNLPLWIEKGTEKGKRGSHTQGPAPFLYVSADLEASAHDRRMREGAQDALDEVGLGG